MSDAPKIEPEYKYDWQKPDFDASQDKFMQRFDANGNFVNPPKVEEPEPEIKLPDFFYHFKKDAND